MEALISRKTLALSLLLFALPVSGIASEILLTAFEPFGGVPVNNSERVMRAAAKRLRAAGANVRECILPVEYDRGAEVARRCAQGHKWDLVLSLGAGGCSLDFETRARNLDNTWSGDNAGVVRRQRPIVPGGDDWRELSAPMHSLFSRAPRLGSVRITHSADMGNYVCNNTAYWLAGTYPAGGVVPYGFVHVPPTTCAAETSDADLLARILVGGIAEAMPQLF